MKTLILLVDDDADDREIFLDAVRAVDPSIIVEIATDGVEALTMLNSSNSMCFSLMFLDMNMPRLNGKQVLEEMKINTTLKKVPVVILSTSRHTRDVEAAMVLGAKSFYSKPDSYVGLCSLIKNVLQNEGLIL